MSFNCGTAVIRWRHGIHINTHGAYDPEYLSDAFSDVYVDGERMGDKINAINRGLPSYLGTPLGTLRRYNPSDGSDIEVYNDIPWDTSYPNR